jgi:metallo-beta-lactamase family protein
MKVKFWGAARTVTGSMHLLQLDNGKQILLDCGLYQGEESFADEYNRTFPCDPRDIDLVILSHAHIDHCGNLPQLVKSGFKGEIFCTHATYDLTAVLLRDSAGIQENDAKSENKWRRKKGKELVNPLYTTFDVAPALSCFVALSYARWHKISDGIELMFLDAGHMLGSASVSLRIQDGDRAITLGFTGDIGRPGSPILRDPQPMPQSQFVISECTYGGVQHPTQVDSKEQLLAIITDACVTRRGKLIIPAFSVGRTQNIVYTLDQLCTEGRLPEIPVYVDSPLSVNASEVFKMHPECFDEELSAYLEHDPNPFGFKRLEYVREAEDSKRLNTQQGPFIVIASSGMMNAGRILHHLANGIEDPRNTILVTGYCAENTIGARIVNGDPTVRIFGEEYQVRAKVEKLVGYSGHADQDELGDFITQSFAPDETQSICLVHGDEERASHFRAYLAQHGYKNVLIPRRGETILV